MIWDWENRLFYPIKKAKEVAMKVQGNRYINNPEMIKNKVLNWNPSFQFASLSSDLANRLHT